jgi:hypothetical protein
MLLLLLLLLLLLQEWHIIGINTSSWRSRVLAPMTEPRSGPLDSIMMAITGVGAIQLF